MAKAPADNNNENEEQDAFPTPEAETEVAPEAAAETPVEEVQTEVTESAGGGDGGMDAAETSSDERWQRTLEEAGFKDFNDVNTAVERAVESMRQKESQVQELARQVKFYQDQSQAFAGRTYEQATPHVESPAVEDKDAFSRLIDGWVDPASVDRYLVNTEDGRRAFVDNIDEETKAHVLGVDKKVREWQELISDPRKFAEAVDSRVNRMIAEKFETSFEEKQTAQQEEATVNAFINQNANWLYERDPATGEFLVDPVNNQFIYSQQGETFLSHMDRVAADGITSVSKQLHWATQAMGGYPALAQAAPVQQEQQAPVAQATVQDQAQAQRQAMRGRKNTNKSRQRTFNGVNPDSGSQETGEAQMSFGEKTLAAMKSGVE